MIIFGAGKLSEIGGGLAKSIKAFKKEMKDDENPTTVEHKDAKKDWFSWSFIIPLGVTQI